MDKKQSTEHKNTSPLVRVVVVLCGVTIAAIVAVIVFSTFFNSAEIEPAVEVMPVENEVVLSVEGDVSNYTYVSEVVVVPDRLPSDNTCKQLLLADTSGSYVTLTFYENYESGWVERFTTNGRCGVNGVVQNKQDGDGCTPVGEFPLTFCCGVSKPTTDLDFQWVDADTVWVDDPDSRYYNTLQSSDLKNDWDSAEELYSDYFAGGEHTYCINIGANGDGLTPGDAVPGNGSLITLCGKTTVLKETRGCIDISATDMASLLSYLDSNKNPQIIIY